MLLLSLLCIYFAQVTSENMFLFWGYPTDDGNFCVKNSSTVDFRDCMQLCLGRQNCVAVYGCTSNCMLCDTYNIQSFIQTNSSSGTMFAVKIDQQDQCPVDVQMGRYLRTEHTETAKDECLSMLRYFQNGNDSYTLEYNEPVWTIDYKQKCPENGTWRIFTRAAGPICLTVIPTGPVNMIIWTEAFRECMKLGTSSNWQNGFQLAGMNSVEERQYIIDTAKSLLAHTHNKGYYTVWLNGWMRQECLIDSNPTLPSYCVGMDAFMGTPFVDNYSAYQWTNGQPDLTWNSVYGWPYACLQLMIGQDQKAWEGIVTNVMCEYTCNGGDALCAMGYVCAGPATTL